MPTLSWPLPGRFYITRGWAYKDPLYYLGQHSAIDMIRTDVPTYGSPVIAVADGTLMANPFDSLSGYNVYVDHADGWRSGYRHFIRLLQPVNVPIAVRQGDVIGYAGSTGASTGPHLHFDLWNQTQKSTRVTPRPGGWWAHDPEEFLGKEIEGDFLMSLTDAEQQKILALANAFLDPKPYGAPWYNRTAPPFQMMDMTLSYFDGVHLAHILAHTQGGFMAIGPSGGTVYHVRLVGNQLRKAAIPDPATFVGMGGKWGCFITIPQVTLNGMANDPTIERVP